MKHLIQLTLCTLIAASVAHAQKVSDMTTRTTLGSADKLSFSYYDGSVYATRAITGANLAASIASLADLANTYQAKDATLSALAGLSTGSGYVPYATGTDTFSQFATTSFGRGLVNSADAAAVLSTLGTDALYQAKTTQLDAWGGVTISSGKMYYGTGSNTLGSIDSTSFGRGLLNETNAASLLSTLGISSQWVSASHLSTYTNSATSFTTEQGIFLRNQLGADDYRTLNVMADGSVAMLGGETGWTGGSEFRISFPYADGQLYEVTMHGANGLIPVAPDISTHAGEVLAVNGTGDDFEWITNSSSLPSQTGNDGGILRTNGSTPSWVTSLTLTSLDAGSLTIGSIDVVTVSGAQILTNKTINGGNNTLSNISLTSAVTGTLPVAHGGTGITSFGSGVATAMGNAVNASAGLLTYGIIGTSGAAVPLLNSAVTFSGGVTVTSNNLTVGNSGAVAGTGRAIYVGDYVSSAGGQAQYVATRPGTYYWGIGHPGGFSATFVKMGGCSSAGGTWASDSAFGLLIDGGLALGALDCVAYRDAAAVWQMGADAATATAQALKAHDGSGTDKAGAALNLAGGQSTGTGRGGDVIVHTSMSSTTGSSANSYSTRAFYAAKYVDLTESTATAFAKIAVASGKSAGAKIECSVYANDGTEYQSLASELLISAVNKAGTVTVTVVQEDGTTAASSGTLTATYTVVASGNSFDVKCNATSSLTQTSLRIRYVITALNSDGGDSALTSGSIVTP